MTDTDQHTGQQVNQPDEAQISDEAREAANRLSPEDVDSLIAAAQDPETDIPVGAEEYARALAQIGSERDELVNKLQRTAADYQNFQRRARSNEDEARRQGMGGVIQSILSIMDTFDLALNQDPEKVSAQTIMGGVQAIKAELLRVLSNHGVRVIEPAPGEPFDPMQAEAVMRQPSADVEPGSVLMTLSAGYALGDRVVRPAKVSIADPIAEGETQSGEQES